MGGKGGVELDGVEIGLLQKGTVLRVGVGLVSGRVPDNISEDLSHINQRRIAVCESSFQKFSLKHTCGCSENRPDSAVNHDGPVAPIFFTAS